MADRDGWKHDDEGWYDEGVAENDDGVVENDEPDDAAAEATTSASPYRALPPRTRLEDTVAEVDTTAPPEEPPGDPNRETAVRIGLMGGAG